MRNDTRGSDKSGIKKKKGSPQAANWKKGALDCMGLPGGTVLEFVMQLRLGLGPSPNSPPSFSSSLISSPRATYHLPPINGRHCLYHEQQQSAAISESSSQDRSNSDFVRWELSMRDSIRELEPRLLAPFVCARPSSSPRISTSHLDVDAQHCNIYEKGETKVYVLSWGLITQRNPRPILT